MNQLEETRHEKDNFFLSSPHSPLNPDQKSHFNSLNYFPKNPELDLILELEEFEDKEQITMQSFTPNGDLTELMFWYLHRPMSVSGLVVLRTFLLV